MGQVSAELKSIRQLIESRDELDAERRKVDDERYGSQARRTDHLLERVDGHGGRIRTLEVNWATFFSENGAFTFVKKAIGSTEKKIEATDKQNRWIIGLIITTLITVILNLITKH